MKVLAEVETMKSDDRFEFRLESARFSCERIQVRKIVGSERISRLFSIDVDIVCLEHEGIDIDAVPGAPVTIVIERFRPDGEKGWSGTRRIHGMVAEVDDSLSAHADVRHYQLRIVPRLFSLSLVELQDIFMGSSVPELVKAKLDAMEIDAGFDPRLIGKYPTREFVVQYKETDLAFISRLTEHDGISYFLEHGESRSTLVLCDHPAGFPWIEGEVVSFDNRGAALDVFELSVKRRVVPAYYAVGDYNYRTPHVDLTADHDLAEGLIGGVIEYGPHFKTPEEGRALARVRAEERLGTQLVYTGKSNLPALFAGARFKLEDHPDLGSLELLVVEVRHEASQVAAGSNDTESRYVNTFSAVPAERTYRPERVTPKPRIAGLITAVVDSPTAGSTKYAQIDEQGRYLVRFAFDTAPSAHRAPSRPVRMLQNHAGENYGTHFPLRPGVEVAVGFVDGDPDRPIIVGAVPNPRKPSPVTNANPGLHRIKTASGIVVDMVEDR